jgi:dTDP-4-dehydrorhamnose 3,5-epimerase
MRRLDTRLVGPILLEPDVHGDERGFFVETYRRETFHELGIDVEFVQHNQSRSSKGVLRGMHYQLGLAKHVRCARGRILDVIVDIRQSSGTFGQWEAFTLDDETHNQLFVPAGFAHGFCVLSDVADVIYVQSDYYDPARDRGIAFDDPDVGIAWPGNLELQTSERDRSAPRLRDVHPDELPD